MNQKRCIDCNNLFLPTSNRSIRCNDCQIKVRKVQKAKDKKKARSLRTLDGIAIIHKEKGLEPISARGHQNTSNEIKYITIQAGPENLPHLIGPIKNEMKYNKNNIRELRTKISLISHWRKIAKQIEKDDEWRYERILDEILKDISDNDIFDYLKLTSDFEDVRKRANSLDNSIIEIINLGVENIRKLFDEENKHLIPPEDNTALIYISPIDRLKEFRKWKRTNLIRV